MQALTLQFDSELLEDRAVVLSLSLMAAGLVLDRLVSFKLTCLHPVLKSWPFSDFISCSNQYLKMMGT